MSITMDGHDEADPDKSGVLTKSLIWLWDSVLSGSDYISGSLGVAAPTLQPQEIESAVSSIIWNHAMMAGGTGMVTNLGGLITLPVAIPANIASVYAIQMRMMQEICRARGFDPKEPFIRTIAIVSLLGSAALEALEQILKGAGQKIAFQLLKQLPGSVLIAINQAVGFRLLTKFGTTGVVNLGRWVPILGGVLCGGMDYMGTRAVGWAFNEILIRATDGGGHSNSGNSPSGPNVPSCAGSETYAQAVTDPEMHGPKRKKKEFREKS